MTLIEQLSADMAASMKAGDAPRTGVIRLLRSSMGNEKIKLGHELSDDEALAVLKREAKQRRDSIEQYQAADRNDLVATEQSELELIQQYLPAAMGEDELTRVIDEVVAELGATSPAQMGAVIGAVMKRAGAAADGGDVARLVRSRLAG